MGNIVYVYKSWFTDNRILAKEMASSGKKIEVKKRYIIPPKPIVYPIISKRKAFIIAAIAKWNNAIVNAEETGDWSVFYNDDYEVLKPDPQVKRKSLDGKKVLVEIKVLFTEYEDHTSRNGADKLDTMKKNGSILDWHYYKISDAEITAGKKNILTFIDENKSEWENEELK